MMVHAYNRSAQEAEEGLRVQDQPGWHSQEEEEEEIWLHSKDKEEKHT
jgi:hypothetical protein